MVAGEEVALQSLEESKGGTYKSPTFSGFIENKLNIFSQTVNTDVIYLSATLRTEKPHFCRVLFARQRERIIDLSSILMIYLLRTQQSRKPVKTINRKMVFSCRSLQLRFTAKYQV